MRIKLTFVVIILFAITTKQDETKSWIRINQLGYQPGGVKVAVWCSKENNRISNWELVDAVSKKIVFTGETGKSFGAYGPFTQTYRFSFSEYKKPGRYYLQAVGTRSPEFEIEKDVY